MRSYRILSGFLAVLLVLAGATFADTAEGQAADFRIGVVNLKEVFDNYQKQKDLYDNLRASRDTMQKPIDELSATINKDKERYEKEKDTLEAGERRALEEKIEANFTKYRAEYDRAQQDIDRQEKKLIRDVFEEIYMAVQEVGAQGNYHLIFESGEAAPPVPGRTGGLLYHSTTLNMTQRVIEHLNGKYNKK